jgi:undecaprenyl diphosphate synthase
MPFQSAYSELIFTDILFPDFTPTNLIDAIKEFENRKRKFGR